jgi:hypothetical protein
MVWCLADNSIWSQPMSYRYYEGAPSVCYRSAVDDSPGLVSKFSNALRRVGGPPHTGSWDDAAQT